MNWADILKSSYLLRCWVFLTLVRADLGLIQLPLKLLEISVVGIPWELDIPGVQI